NVYDHGEQTEPGITIKASKRSRLHGGIFLFAAVRLVSVLPSAFLSGFGYTLACFCGKGTRETALIARFGVTFAVERRGSVLPLAVFKQKVYMNEARAD
ncbi:MAG: hypothetical protein IIZ42_01200, partial [Eubacterium sp.]|nr:hypothetical protein [Eubacterium sp.]